MKILVLGSEGQLGRCLTDQINEKEHNIEFISRKNLDITNGRDTEDLLVNYQPDLIINAAAYTAVDAAEENPTSARLINHSAVGNIASVCKALNCKLIHVSTDYVFDGSANSPYREDDLVNPKTIYGISKRNGELAVQSSGCDYIILRTSWVFSEYGKNFLKTILKMGLEHDELSIVSDQIGCPTYAQDIAKVITIIISQLELKPFNSGIFHYCGDESCSWYDFAKTILHKAKIRGLVSNEVTIKPIETNEYVTRAIRPKYSVLNCAKIKNIYGVAPSNWRDGIDNCLNSLMSDA